ncbi:MAG: PQQ-dependent sugar dehydrogenase [Aestuariivirgaceae bacterium]
MRRRTLAAGLAILAVPAVLYFLFAPTFNAPVAAQALGFEDEARLAKRLKVADGYQLSLFAASVGRARVMQQTAAGNFVVTAARDGTVVLVRGDHDGDQRSDGVEVLAGGLVRPHGLIIEGDDIFIAESHQVTVSRLVNEDQPGKAALEFQRIVLKGIPADGGHSTRTIGHGPDGRLYVSVGSSCNVCIERHPWRAAMLHLGTDGKAEIHAEGLRNSVGFDWRPGTDQLYAVNAGRDALGDDFPREEMNLVVQGAHYGWPYVNDNNVPDPDYGERMPASVKLVAPVHRFTAHSTPLSIRFLRHQRDISAGSAALVARRGSWNRSAKSGYDVVLLRWADDGSISQEPFITGFEVSEDVIGRPVGVLETPDGSLYITDDFARAVYRVVRTR